MEEFKFIFHFYFDIILFSNAGYYYNAINRKSIPINFCWCFRNSYLDFKYVSLFITFFYLIQLIIGEGRYKLRAGPNDAPIGHCTFHTRGPSRKFLPSSTDFSRRGPDRDSQKTFQTRHRSGAPVNYTFFPFHTKPRSGLQKTLSKQCPDRDCSRLDIFIQHEAPMIGYTRSGPQNSFPDKTPIGASCGPALNHTERCNFEDVDEIYGLC